MDVGISCSIREGLGLNVIEAMLSGNTFIATKNRGHNELIQDSENGFLVDVGDYQTLAKRIKVLMDDKALKEKMSKTAQERIRPYALDETLVELNGIFESL